MRTAAVVLRGAVWPTTAGLTGAALVLGVVADADARSVAGPGLLQVAFALLAASAAATLDDPAGAVADVAPVGYAKQTLRRSAALTLPLSVGTVLISGAAFGRMKLPVTDLCVALVGGVTLGFAVAVIARCRVEEPGRWAPTAVAIALVAGPALPLIGRRVAFFPGEENSGALSSTAWWLLATPASLVVIAAVLRRANHP